MKKTRKEVFDKLVERIPEAGCWIWMGTIDRGYGVFNYDKRHMGAHRVSWLLHCGPIPSGMLILHKCDVKCCVNPDHLYVGTPQQNVDDAFARNRRAVGARHWRRLNPQRQHGEEGPNASLTEDQVREIRRSTERPTALARKYGVSSMQIRRIVHRQSWQHVQE